MDRNANGPAVGNVASVSWGDHLAFGEADGRLETPEAVGRRLQAWRDELGASVLHWRVFRRRIPGTFFAAPGHRHPSAAPVIDWDEFEVVPRLARDAGLEPLLYVSVFDEGWPLAPPEVRAVSHHNAMHGRDVAWQSAFSLAHPEWAVRDALGRAQHGVLSLAVPEVRAHFVERFTGWVDRSDFSGLFLCLRSQSRPADHADQFDHRGEHLTAFLRDLRTALHRRSRSLWVGAPRGDVLGPPFGNVTLEWRTWLHERLVDALVINQNSSQCPSMWHQLWPMHRGGGYRQNYLTGDGLPSLDAHIVHDYAPSIAASGARLYVARQWDARDPAAEARLRALPGVAGLVFSTFRHDNPAAVARNDWTY